MLTNQILKTKKKTRMTKKKSQMNNKFQIIRKKLIAWKMLHLLQIVKLKSRWRSKKIKRILNNAEAWWKLYRQGILCEPTREAGLLQILIPYFKVFFIDYCWNFSLLVVVHCDPNKVKRIDTIQLLFVTLDVLMLPPPLTFARCLMQQRFVSVCVTINTEINCTLH